MEVRQAHFCSSWSSSAQHVPVTEPGPRCVLQSGAAACLPPAACRLGAAGAVCSQVLAFARARAADIGNHQFRDHFGTKAYSHRKIGRLVSEALLTSKVG